MKRAHRSAHALIWLLLAPLLAAVMFLALSVRPPPPGGALPEAADAFLQGAE